MKIYNLDNPDPGVFIREMLEKETNEKIFTMRVWKDDPQNEELEVIVIFEDKSVLMATVEVETIQGKLAARIQGNYI